MATDPLDVLSDDELLLVLDYLLPHELGACEVACRRVWKLSSGDMHAKYWTRQCGEVGGASSARPPTIPHQAVASTDTGCLGMWRS